MEILDALQRPAKTLETLTLSASNHDLRENPEIELTHFEGFWSMHALHVLKVPSYLLIGRAGASRELFVSDWEFIGNFTYPALRDVLPRNLKELKIEMRQEYILGGRDIEEVLLSALPSEAGTSYRDSSHSSPLYARLEFKGLDVDEIHLPLDFWRVQPGCEHAGAIFMYNIELLLGSDFCKLRKIGPQPDTNYRQTNAHPR